VLRPKYCMSATSDDADKYLIAFKAFKGTFNTDVVRFVNAS
jgi:hypothetical protein